MTYFVMMEMIIVLICLICCFLTSGILSLFNQVSRLILLSGGNPNSRTEYLNNAPILCVAAREGFADMVSLLMEFGADPNAASETGMTPLCHAAAAGHREVMRMLCLKYARVSAVNRWANILL